MPSLIRPKQHISYVYRHRFRTLSIAFIFILLIVIALLLHLLQARSITTLEKSNKDLTQQLQKSNQQLTYLKSQDQYKINQTLMAQQKNIQDTYSGSIKSYQDIQDLVAEKQKTGDLTQLYVQTIQYLGKMDYSSGSAELKQLQAAVKTAQDTYAASLVPVTSTGTNPNSPISNSAPGNGFSQQQVRTVNGTFTVDIIAADLSSTRVIVDTASDSTCTNNCPALSLSDYVSRSGAYAGINGTYFCPIDYPSCAGKTNSFDTLLMNKNKVYFNSDNNVYSTVPAVIISGSSVRFVSQSLQWGRDTSPDMVLAMQPLLVLGGQIVLGATDAKQSSVGAKGFIANKGSTVYIGDVLNATMQDSANVMHALGMDNALNLDEGGSTALWYGGYKLGPGRQIPNAVLFVHK